MVALSWGVSPEQYKNLNSYDVACCIRAGQAKERRWLNWMRWAVAAMMTPHYKKGIDPEQLFKFPDETEAVREDVDKLNSPEEMEKTQDFFDKVWMKEFGKPLKTE